MCGICRELARAYSTSTSALISTDIIVGKKRVYPKGLVLKMLCRNGEAERYLLQR